MSKCALCCGAIKKTAAVQCKKCKGLLHAIYCSQKCLKADASRHKDECYAAVEIDGQPEELAAFHKDKGPDALSTVYTCGSAMVEGKKGFEVRRTLPSETSRKRPAPEDFSPMQEWKKRFVEGSTACCKPWVNFASSVSLMVTWLPPTASSRFTQHTYLLEQREVPDPASGRRPASPLGSSSECSNEWECVKEIHTGSTPSWWVNNLTTGSWMQFRVKVTGPGEWAEKGTFSEPTDPFRVGYADYSCMPTPPEGLPVSDFSEAEKKFFKTLDTPAKVQDFLDTIPMNHEVAQETNYSALETLRQYQGHCIEGAQLGAYIMSLNGHPAYLMDMIAHEDDCHNIVPFRVNGKWGALSVSNHASLRWRNPVYRTIRELMLSYFDDYMNGKGERTLHAYTQPYNMDIVFGPRWAQRRGDVWPITRFGDQCKVYKLVDVEDLKGLRPADEMMHATTVSQRAWRCPDNFDEEAVRRNENK